MATDELAAIIRSTGADLVRRGEAEGFLPAHHNDIGVAPHDFHALPYGQIRCFLKRISQRTKHSFHIDSFSAQNVGWA
jgi:hypothetical protein